MTVRCLLCLFVALAILLGGGKPSAADKQNTKKATGVSLSVKKVDIKIDSIPWSSLKRNYLKKQSWSSKKGVHGPGDFWTPEMLQKIRSRNK